MADFVILNNRIRATISSLGGELKSLIVDGTSVIWEGDNKWWGKSAPILFPNIGFLRDDQFLHDGTTYSLPKHGTLRTSELQCNSHSDSIVEFEFNTKKMTEEYPFDFTVRIIFEIVSKLSVRYEIRNNSNKIGYCCIGSHPAIKLFPSTFLNEYKVEFSQDVEGPYYLDEGLVKLKSEKKIIRDVLLNQNVFTNDALIYEAKGLCEASLLHISSGKKVILGNITGCSYFALWAPVGAPFICLEPWTGIPDPVDSTKEISKKESVISIAPLKVFHTGFSFDLD